jgi:ATP-dependent 26S proteasome regulatory subunit
LSKIEPSPKLALNFHDASGTGKTMAAHTLVNAMNRKIMASYAEIESKYHGDGPKNVKKLFRLASETNAVLFIDEADSLLSKRLTNVTRGSEQASFDADSITYTN